MRWVFIGHRGTGKTSLLQRVSEIFTEQKISLPCFDLDFEIEKSVGQSLTGYFENNGELRFREKEIDVFESLVSKHPMFVIALGAGFPVERIPKDIRRIWIRRKCDGIGRIFLNRPRLDTNLDPLAEYRSRYVQRESNFQHVADWIYTMPEGLRDSHSLETLFFTGSCAIPQGILTLYPHHFRETRPVSFAQTLEIRDDLLTEAEQALALKQFAHKDFIYSHRKSVLRSVTLPAKAVVDWPMELGPAPTDFTGILSAHNRPDGLSLADWVQQLSALWHRGLHLKLSPLIASFSELKFLADWQQQDPENRSLFPRSMDGRWNWFRHLWAGRQKYSFWQDGMGSALDQPLWWEEFGYPMGKVERFAAVLGGQVLGSYSPWTHFDLFRSLGLPFYAICISEDEFNLAWSMLTDWGLAAAAVTSPLKKLAFDKAQLKSKLVQEMGVCNTLTLADNGWRAELTDIEGFLALVEEVEKKTGKPRAQWKVMIWGGGGTLPTIHAVLPQAVSFSVRTGRPRHQDAELKLNSKSFDFLIWAAAPDAELPPKEWQISTVVDLNYREESRARELAQIRGITYVMGLKMFEVQAMAQQKVWKDLR